jgi:2-methylcitrate dehydratase PrpD
MTRRSFIKSSLGAGTALGILGGTEKALGAGGGPPAFPKVPDLTRHVAEFVANTAYADLPGEVIELGKKSILDELGLAIASANSKGTAMLRDYIRALGCASGDTTVIGTAEKLPLRFAVLANGVAIHMEDFDDTQLAVAKDRVYGLLMHPTVAVLPAAIGLAEKETTSGREFMLAYHVGVEVECKLAEACSPRCYNDGFHSTGVFGVFGSAAACAKVRRQEAGQIQRAFAIAATHAGGLRENFGTLCKPLQAGQAAEAGVVASDLAALGWDGAPTILEANNGFFHAYGGGLDPAAIEGKLGRPWTFAMPGISIKPHPSGSLTHPGMTEMLRLIRANSIRASDVESVDVGTNSRNLSTLIHHHPKTGLQAKFSMEYSMAVLLVAGKAGLNEYTDEAVNRPDVQEMIGRVHFYADPEAEAAGFDKMTTIIKIHLKDGRTLSGRADFGKGSPANPMSFGEVAEKFRDSSSFGRWPAEKASRIVEFVRNLENAPDLRPLIALCSA